MNLRSAFFEQRLTGNNSLLKEAFANEVENNVRNDSFSALKIEYAENICDVVCNDVYTAILGSDTNLLTLYENFTFQPLWQAHVTMLGDYRHFSMTVSDTGMVLCSSCHYGPDHLAYKPHFQVFVNGQRTGTFDTNHNTSLSVMQNRIFGNRGLNIYEWDIYGEQKQTFLLDCMNCVIELGSSKSALSKQYLIVSLRSISLENTEFKLPTSILNLHSNKVHSFDLATYGIMSDHTISAIEILNNELFIAYRTKSVLNHIHLLVIDIETGDCLKNYYFNEIYCFADRLLVNKDYIVFQNHFPNSSGNMTIYAINRQTHMLTMPLTATRDILIPQKGVQLTGSLLTVMGILRSRQLNTNYKERYLIDLKNCQVLQNIRYRDNPAKSSFFTPGVYASVSHQEGSIYIERFNSTSGNKTCDPEMSLRMM